MGNFFGYASKITRVFPTTTALTQVYAGGKVRVWGFTVNNTSASTITATLTTNESTPTTLWTASLLANTSTNVPIPFIADYGLQVQASTGSTLSFTFYHSQEGS